jgi:hypothetical protein
MNRLDPEIALLDDIHAWSSSFVGSIRGFVDDPRVRRIAATYAANADRRKVDLGFNAFALVSDLYYRENFHSDMMVAILDPRGAHGQGDRFLRLFLEFLRDRHHLDIEPDDYRNAQVVPESAKIDVLIWDKTSGKAIIVENKINGAPDMDRQVVRYLEEVEDGRRLKCDAIVYLTLQQRGWPGTHGWTNDERERVSRLLKPICAFANAPDDLHSGWLGPCVGSAADSSLEVAHVIRQYRQIILKLGQNVMNQPLMQEFYDLLKVGERYKAALNLKAIMNDLPAFRCQRLIYEFQKDVSPFSKVYPYRPTVAVFENCGLENLKIHVDTTSNESSTLSFWNCIDGDEKRATPERLLRELGLIDQFRCQDGWFNREFSFPCEEQALYEFLRSFLKKLRDSLSRSKSSV